MAESHAFLAKYTKETDWQEDTSLLTLPKGVQVKVLNEDREMGRVDIMIKFPPGYYEPLHTHDSWHSIVVLEGLMRIGGYDLRPGDYVFGWDEEHGPYEYPEGCVVFAVFMGKSLAHKWDEKDNRN